MQSFYFFFHKHEQYKNHVQQVIASSNIKAQFIMNATYSNKWSNMCTQDEFEALIKQNRTQAFKPLPPLYY